MIDRVPGRHRAPARATTPLSSLGTSLTSTVSEHVTGISRSGAILAVSSGLVASMGMPAGAVVRDTPNTATLSRTATPGPVSADLTVASSSFVSGDPLTAPATATLTFDRSTITANPRPQAAPTPRVSRSAARTAFQDVGSDVASRTVTGGSFGSARGSSVIAVAARYLDIPYRSGGTTPVGFDCSGYVRYVFALLGVDLPRTADEQYHAVTRVPSSQARPGDLVFFHRGGTVYHVGIYAGGGMMYDSGRPGQAITKRDIWSADISFGRA